jgi:hypothetical protein
MSEQQYKQVDKFDRAMGELTKLPDTTHTKPSPVQATTPLVGGVQVFVVQTFRRKEEGDIIFLQYMDADQHIRLVLPPAVADAIARQRESLTTMNRKRAAKAQAAARKARGELPGFMKKKGKKPATKES